MHLWRRGRAVECTGLENRQGFIALREFESHRLRQIEKALTDISWGFFYGNSNVLFKHLLTVLSLVLLTNLNRATVR